MEQVRLLSVTCVLTLLIWASADSLVNEAVEVRATIEPVAASSDMLVRATSEEPFDLTVSGPRNVVAAIQAQAPLNLRVPVDDRATGAHTVTLDRSRLKQHLSEQYTEFRKLTVVSIKPSSLPVLVDHWVERTVDVVVKRTTLSWDVPPQVSPQTVTVRMRESVLAERPPDAPLEIDIGPEIDRVLREQSPGETVTFPIALDARAFGARATLSPSAVQVTAAVQTRRLTAQIPTVPILVAVSFANLDRAYQAVSRDGTPLSLVTQTISVTGATEAVQRLERGADRVYGIIHLKQSDFDQLGVLRLMTPEYQLPRGVTLAEPPPPIEFKLIDSARNEDGAG